MATKTTIELDDELFVAAKREAATRRTTLRTIVEKGLRTELQGERRQAGQSRRKIRWVVVDGGLPEDIAPSDRAQMMDALRRR